MRLTRRPITYRRLVSVPASIGIVIFALSAASAGGRQLWATRYDAPGDGTDQALAIGASPGGSKVFVTGYSAGVETGNDFATAAYDASTGAQVWGERYNGPGNNDDIARAIAPSPDGSRVFVTGGAAGAGGSQVFTTVAYDAATGNRLWVARFDDPSSGTGFSAVVSPDGSSLFVAGDSQGTGGGDYATVAYDPATGAQRWAATYNGQGDGFDIARSIGVSPDGSKVFVTGTVQGDTSQSDYGTVAYDAHTGAQLWGEAYNGPNNDLDYGNALAVAPGGGVVFVTGQSNVLAGADYGTVAYDASTGARLWARQYNGPGDGNDAALAIAASPGGSMVFVTGQSDGMVGFADFATVAYDASVGATRWVQRYNGPGNGGDYGSAIAVSPSGSKVFVTGQSDGGSSGWDFATVAYGAATGAGVWLKRFTGAPGGFDSATSIAASPGGLRVFVTGTSAGPGGDDDFATVAYSA